MKNIYKIAFEFGGQFHYTSFDSNAVANQVAVDIIGDAVADMSTEYNQWFEFEFSLHDKKYKATFAYDSLKHLNIYECKGEDEMLVESEVPYTIVGIENGENTLLELSKLI